jgi:hypothetical protein
MKFLLRFFFHLLLFVLLTILTQIGGLIYLLSIFVRRQLAEGPKRWLVFPLIYFIFWLVTPIIAKPLGRVPLPYRATEDVPLQAQHWFLVLANRHYVKPELKKTAILAAQLFEQKHNGTPLTYLDANFPFWDGFPLLPHRSHDDGRKLDLAFLYQQGDQLTSKAPGFLGYGRFVAPAEHIKTQADICAKQGYWQYSLLKPLARPFLGNRYLIDEKSSRQMVQIFAQQNNIRKLFLEPHLKQRWKLARFDKIRFHGCAAVRHDDHLHVQL